MGVVTVYLGQVVKVRERLEEKAMLMLGDGWRSTLWTPSRWVCVLELSYPELVTLAPARQQPPHQRSSPLQRLQQPLRGLLQRQGQHQGRGVPPLFSSLPFHSPPSPPSRPLH